MSCREIGVHLEVLLVEDNPAEARLLTENLADVVGSSYTLTHVERLSEACTKLADARFDVVLLDLSLPDSQGLETITRVLASAPDIPVVVLTGQADDELALAGVRCGAQDYLVKGEITASLLARAIHYAIERQRLVRSVRDHEQALAEEVQVSSALAQVGRQLVSSLDTKILLRRLCRAAADGFACLYADVWQRAAGSKDFVPVVSHGHTAAAWEALRATWITDDLPYGMLDDLRRDGVASVPVTRGLVGGAAGEPAGVDLFIALHAGGTICGVLRVGFAEMVSGARSDARLRIARGVARVASMALENARLVSELKNANELKSNFVATMSHELRTPLAAIIGYIELIGAGVFGDVSTEMEEPVTSIDRNSQHLLSLIESILQLTDLDHGKSRLNLRDVAVARLMTGLAGEVSKLAEESGATVEWFVPETVVLRTDASKLRVILRHLVDNAIKFGSAGSIRVVATSCPDGVDISVSDTGIGIAKESWDAIFEPFRQLEDYLTRRYGGIGLGLYLVRRTLDLLGGEISVESEVGRGSTFTISIPSLSPERFATQDISDGTRKTVDELTAPL